MSQNPMNKIRPVVSPLGSSSRLGIRPPQRISLGGIRPPQRLPIGDIRPPLGFLLPLVVLALVLATMPASAVAPAAAVPSLIRLEGLSPSGIHALTHRGLDVAKVGADYVEAAVQPLERAALQAAGFRFRTLIPDLNAEIRNVLSRQTRESAYFTVAGLNNMLREWASRYPSICRLESIGKTFEGRDIWALKVSDNPRVDEREPSALILGGTHAREWISYQVVMEALRQLLDGYGTNPELTRLVDTRETWFVPMLNPDGVEYCMAQNMFWRKNRNRNPGGSFGVDPNRNFGYQWGGDGSSSDEKADNYRGLQAFSEAETRAVRDLTRRERFAACLSFHSYSELVLFPWSYSTEASLPHLQVIERMAIEMAKISGYHQQPSSSLYTATGEAGDYLYGTEKVLPFTIEIGKGFIPPADQIPTHCAANVPCVFYLIDKAGTYGLVTPSGNALIPDLDSRTALAAVTDLAPHSGNDAVARTLAGIERTLVRRAVEESAAGRSTILPRLSASEASSPVAKIMRRKVAAALRFEQLHR